MRIKISSIHVSDQDRALKFYTEVLGFVKRMDAPAGLFRWLTVVSPEGPEDLELLLEPVTLPEVKQYQRALYKEGIPATSFHVSDMEAEYTRLQKRGVVFRNSPVRSQWGIDVLFDDTCGNLINLHQPTSWD